MKGSDHVSKQPGQIVQLISRYVISLGGDQRQSIYAPQWKRLQKWVL